MPTLTSLARSVLPYGVVVAVSRARAAQRLADLASIRATQLRHVNPAARYTPDRNLRLNIGCGTHREPRWLNVDRDPGAEVVHEFVNGEPLPFEDASAVGVHSEHFVEHLDRATAVWFFRESARVLKPDGTFRVSCPDLEAIGRMFAPGDESWRGLAAVYEAIGDFPPGVLTRDRVVNHAFYGHGHRYLWSFGDLRRELAAVGFTAIERMAFGESRAFGGAIERREAEAPYSLIVEATRAH